MPFENHFISKNPGGDIGRCHEGQKSGGKNKKKKKSHLHPLPEGNVHAEKQIQAAAFPPPPHSRTSPPKFMVRDGKGGKYKWFLGGAERSSPRYLRGTQSPAPRRDGPAQQDSAIHPRHRYPDRSDIPLAQNQLAPKIGYFYGSKTRERRPLPQHGMIKVLFYRTYTTGNFGASRIEDGVKRELMSAQRSRITARRYSTVNKNPQNSPNLALWRSISQREPRHEAMALQPSAPASFKP